MKIIDLHAHIRRDYDRREYVTKEQMEDMEKNGINLRMISALRGRNVHEQNEFVLKFCKAHGQFLPCAVLNPKAEDCPEELDWLEKTGEFRAVELDPLEHGYIPEITPNIDELFELCESRGLFIKLMTGHGDRTLPGQWEYYIRRHPGTRVVLLHLGGMWDGYSTIETAKRYPNVWLDTSECFELSLFRAALKAVPKEKILFGSGFPGRFTECSLTFFDSFSELAEGDKEKFLYKNAAALLGMEE